MRKTRSVTVSDSQYAVFNGTEYAVLILLNEYAVLDRKLDTPYPMEVDTPYLVIDQNSAQIRRIFLDGYSVLVFRIVIFKYLRLSSRMRDDDEDDGASCASTPSPTTYLNSFRLLNYQRYNIPTSSQQDDDLLFERQTILLNQYSNRSRRHCEESSERKNEDIE
ncbi:hypothetical protein Tco_1309894 [Tanacetum coccineum]